MQDGAISSYDFLGCTSLKCVVLPAGVTTIGSGAFEGCNSLAGTPIPNGIKKVSEGAFSWTNYTSVDLPASLEDFSVLAFKNCEQLTTIAVNCDVPRKGWFDCNGQPLQALEHIILRGSVATTAAGLLEGLESDCDVRLTVEPGCMMELQPIGENTSLTYVSLPNTLHVLAAECFKGCYCLENVALPSSLEEISDSAFEGCTRLQQINIPNGVIRIGNHAFANCSGLREIYIPPTVQTLIGKNYSCDCFLNCTNLKVLYFNTSAKFGAGILKRTNADHLEKIIFGPAATNIDVDEFGTYSSNRILTPTLNQPFEMEIHSLLDEETLGELMLRVRTCLTRLTLPEGMEEVNGNIFSTPVGEADTALEELIIPEGVTLIHDLSSVPHLSKVQLPETLTTIRNSFNYCNSLTEAELPYSLKTMEQSFNESPALTRINLNDGLSTIEQSLNGCGFTEITLNHRQQINNSLNRCPNLTRLSFTGCELKGIIGQECPVLSEILIGQECTLSPFFGRVLTSRNYETGEPEYRPVYGTTEPATDLTIRITSEDIYSLPEYAMTGYKNLTDIELTGTLLEIEADAFTGLTRLKRAVWPACLQMIGDRAFSGCETLKETSSMDQLTAIGEEAFKDCVSLPAILSLDSAESLGTRAFSGCTSLAEVSFGGGLRAIGDAAFLGCARIRSLSLAEGLQEIGAMAFQGCVSLRELRLPSTLKYIGGSAFLGCISLRELTIPATAEGISFPRQYQDDESFPGTDAFNQCIGLTRIILNGPVELRSRTMLTSSANLSEIIFNTPVTEPIAPAFFDSWDTSPSSTRLPVSGIILRIQSGQDHLGTEALAGIGQFVRVIILDEHIQTIGARALADNNHRSRNPIQVIMTGAVREIAENAFENSYVEINLTEDNPYVIAYCERHGIVCHTDNAATKTVVIHHLSDISAFLPDGWSWEETGWEVEEEWDRAVFRCDLTAEVPMPQLVRAGHIFSGWYHSEYFDMPFAGTNFNNNNLVPRWDLNAVRVILSLAGGTADYPADSYVSRDSNELTTLLPERSGYVFQGWYTDPDWTKPFDGVLQGEEMTLYAAWQAESSNVQYATENGETSLIRFRTSDETAEVFYLPAQVDGNPVNRIAAGAFKDCSIRRLVLPATVTTIEDGAFEGIRDLQEIQIDPDNTVYSTINGVLYTADGQTLLYYPVSGRQTMTIPASATRIGRRAFAGSAIGKVYLHSGVESIGEEAFSASELRAISIPEGLREIGRHAFYNSRLMNIRLPITVTVIGEEAFGPTETAINLYGPTGECTAKTYAENNRIPYNQYTLTLIQAGLRSYRIQAGEALILPSDGTASGWYLDEAMTLPFEGNVMPESNLTLYAAASDPETAPLQVSFVSEYGTVPQPLIADQLPLRVAELPTITAPGYLFEGWFADRACTVPVTVSEEDGEYCFTESTILYAAWNEDPTAEQVGFTCRQTEDGLIITGTKPDTIHLAIPATWCEIPITGIDEGAFTANTKLVTADISALSGIELPSALFAGCTSLSQVTLPDNLEALPERAFLNCTALTGITIPDSVRRIGALAFARSGIRKLSLPAGLTYIAADAMDSCSSLWALTMKSGNSYYFSSNNALIDTESSTLIRYAPANPAGSYEIPDGVYAIGKNAFAGAVHLESITGTDKIWSLEPYAFSGCISLKTLPLLTNSHLNEIPGNCFLHCSSLTEITIPEQIRLIGNYAFSGCSKLNQVTIPETVETICPYAFDAKNITVFGSAESEAQRWALQQETIFRDTDAALYAEEMILSGSSHQMISGASMELTPVFLPQGAAEEKVYWGVSDERILSVDDGQIRALAEGESTIYAWTASGLQATWEMNVRSADLQVLLFPKERLNTYVGAEVEFRAITHPETENAEITYSSSDDTIAVISEDGILTALAEGDCTLTAESGNLSATCQVHVAAEAGTTTWRQKLLCFVGQADSLFRMPDGAVSWQVADPSIAIVREIASYEWPTGHLKGLRTGWTELAVTLESGELFFFDIEVRPTLTNFAFKDETLIVHSGSSEYAQVLTSPRDMLFTSDVHLNYTTEDTDIISVVGEARASDTFGAVVTGLQEGDATITVSGVADGVPITDTLNIKVIEPAVTDIPFDPIPERMEKGDTWQITAALDLNQIYCEPNYEWYSDDESIFTVSKTGLVTAVRPGSASVILREKRTGDEMALHFYCGVAITEMWFEQSKFTVRPGDEITLKLHYLPEDANEIPQFKVYSDYNVSLRSTYQDLLRSGFTEYSFRFDKDAFGHKLITVYELHGIAASADVFVTQPAEELYQWEEVTIDGKRYIDVTVLIDDVNYCAQNHYLDNGDSADWNFVDDVNYRYKYRFEPKTNQNTFLRFKSYNGYELAIPIVINRAAPCQNHHWAQGICTVCGTICSHENVSEQAVHDRDNCTVLDEKTHYVEPWTYLQCVCSDCGAVVYNTRSRMNNTYREQHHFETTVNNELACAECYYRPEVPASPGLHLSKVFRADEGPTVTIDSAEHAAGYRITVRDLTAGTPETTIPNLEAGQQQLNITWTENHLYEFTATAEGVSVSTSCDPVRAACVNPNASFRMTMPTALVQVEAEAFAGIPMYTVILDESAEGKDLSFLNECGTILVVSPDSVHFADDVPYLVLTPEEFEEATE
ncbi:MAG: leucine-rich repeat protein [Clostridia bacterium]|nr:leucine-rich repeat protein [Clostridia bacterium]